MKKHLLLSVACLILIGCSSSNRSINRFIDDHKDNQEAIVMTIPGWLIRSSANWAARFSQDEDEREFIKLGKYIKKVRFMVIDDHSTVGKAEVNSLVNQLKAEDSYHEYVTVRNEGTNVNVMVHETDEIVKGILIMAREDESFTIVNLKSDLPLQLLEEANFSFNKERDH